MLGIRGVVALIFLVSQAAYAGSMATCEPDEWFERVAKHTISPTTGNDTVVYESVPYRERLRSPKPYSELGIDTIQRYIIDHEIDIDVYDVYDIPQGVSVRAFKAWSRKYTRRDYPVVVFRCLPYEDFGDGKNKDIDDNKRIVFYPQYECCDMDSLLSGDKILVNVAESYLTGQFEFEVQIMALIPDAEKALTFKPIKFTYIYRSHRYGDVSNQDKISQRVHYIQRIMRKLEVEQDGRMWFPHYISWPLDLYTIDMEQYKEMTIDARDKPRSVRELFDRIF